MKINPITGQVKEKPIEYPKNNQTLYVPGGFNPQRYYNKSQIDALFAGFTPSGGGSTNTYALEDGPDYQTDYVYVGMLDATTGAWYIYRRTIATNIRLYAQGSSGYTASWAGRTGLSYA